MLRGDDDGVDADRTAVVVFDRDLRLAVGPQVVHHAVAPGAGKPLHELVREHDRHRHQLVGFVAGVAEHQALVAGAAGVDAHRDVGRLPVNRRQHRAGLGVEPERRVRVADFLDRLADDLLEIDVAAGRDLAGDHRQAGRDERLAGDAGHGVLREDGVENRIGDLVGDLVGMAFGDGLRREQIAALTAHVSRAPLNVPGNWRGARAHRPVRLCARRSEEFYTISGRYGRGWNRS